MDLFTLIVTVTMVLGFLFILALGVWHPKTGAQILDWRPTRSAELEAQNDIDDVQQMIDAQNAIRRRRGLPDRDEEEIAESVRRAVEGDDVRVTDGRGAVGFGRLTRLAKRSARLEVERIERVRPPAPLRLLVPVADRDRMLLAAEKAVELGIASWEPVVWRRSCRAC